MFGGRGVGGVSAVVMRSPSDDLSSAEATKPLTDGVIHRGDTRRASRTVARRRHRDTTVRIISAGWCVAPHTQGGAPPSVALPRRQGRHALFISQLRDDEIFRRDQNCDALIPACIDPHNAPHVDTHSPPVVYRAVTDVPLGFRV